MAASNATKAARRAARTIVGVRFHRIGKLYHFDATGFEEIAAGDRVIVETRRGKQMGEVAKIVADPPPPPRGGRFKPVKRRATPRELVMQQAWSAKELPALVTCREKAARVKLKGVKFVKAEYNYDGSRLAFFYSSDDDERVETSALVKELRRSFREVQIDMQQIGPRDVAKILGGYGACGGPRCCSTHLTEFSPISIKMAKAQGVSLDPMEITGMCGRLRCCLVYEYEQYVAARKGLPKRGKRVGTPHGAGKVIDQNPLKGTVTVIVSGSRYEIGRDEWEPLAEWEALQKKAAQGCQKRDSGGCDCGAQRGKKKRKN
ncbi:MAG: stage 0 sporulation family protein [Anaerolineales bacterium]